MRICRGAITFAIFVSAMAAVVLGSAARATAQPPVPPLRLAAQLPDSRMLDIMRQRVHTVMASVLDPGLPPIAFDEWLFSELAPVFWYAQLCEPSRVPISEGGAELCMNVTTPVIDGRSAHIVIAAGKGVVGSDNQTRWRSTRPAVRDVYVERATQKIPGGLLEIPGDSLDVPSLRDLANMMSVPVDQWPTADLVATISAIEAPAGSVRFTIDVTNRGTRPVMQVSVRVRVSGDGVDILRDWFPDVKAGQVTRLEFNAPIPPGPATAVVEVKPAARSKTIRESSPRRDPAFTIRGDASWRRQ
jgi:hypothetical protein